MKYICSIFLFFSLSLLYSQNEFLDYIVKDGDTIYGKFNTIKKFVDVEGKIHKLKKINTLFFNDKLYNNELITINSVFKKEHPLDSYIVNSVGFFGEIFSLNLKKQGSSAGLINSIVSTMVSSKEKFFVNKEKKLKDYIIKSNDTVYGEITKIKGLKPYLIDAKGNKIKINLEFVQSYRYNNLIYKKVKYLKKRKEKFKFLSEQLNGKITLLVDRVEVNPEARSLRSVQLQSGEEKKYIKIGDQLHLIKQERFLKTLYMLFKYDKEFSKRIRAREFSYANLYLFVKEYNSKFK